MKEGNLGKVRGQASNRTSRAAPQVCHWLHECATRCATGSASAENPAHGYFWGAGADELLADEALDNGGGADQTPGTADDVAWALTDHQNSVRDLVVYDDAGTATLADDAVTVVKHVVYDAFGNVTSTAGAGECVFGYTGRLWDEDTGLQNNLHRWYDPAVGRWLSEDPIGFDGDAGNFYRYCGNSPTNRVDPSGLEDNNINLKLEMTVCKSLKLELSGVLKPADQSGSVTGDIEIRPGDDTVIKPSVTYDSGGLNLQVNASTMTVFKPLKITATGSTGGGGERPGDGGSIGVGVGVDPSPNPRPGVPSGGINLTTDLDSFHSAKLWLGVRW